MSHIPIFAAMGATFLPSFMTNLDAQEVANLGIEVEARNFDRELTPEYGPLFFEIDLSQFEACTVKGLEIVVRDEEDVEIFGAAIAKFGDNSYPFRLAQEHLAAATIAVACDSGPDELDQVYLFKLGEVVRAP